MKSKDKERGLTDAELVEKYERGTVDLKKPLKKMLTKPSQEINEPSKPLPPKK